MPLSELTDTATPMPTPPNFAEIPPTFPLAFFRPEPILAKNLPNLDLLSLAPASRFGFAGILPASALTPIPTESTPA